MWIVYVVEGYECCIPQVCEHSKHEYEHEAEAVCLELERLGFICFIVEKG